jgi:phospholipid/cholesterol/gamma-HCH transport system substrate-binding protein
VRRAIAKHARDFALIVGVVVIAVVVGGYILSNQRFYLPKWVPIVGSDFVDYKAQFSTAQSVTPGQGQTVQVAGVDVGEISKVDLVDGRAVVTMKIRHKYTPIYRDATALLRPKTGLNDMLIELSPGHRTAGAAPKGYTIPVDQTLPNVNFDEILSSLDADTRDYLQLLLGAAGEGVGGQGRELSATLKRFEPTGRSLARLNGALAVRHRNIRHAIHNFRLLAQALGDKDDQLAELVDSSNRVFAVFAGEDAALRDALGELPGALDATDSALTKVDKMAGVLGPTLGDLLPAARDLGPALQQSQPFLRETTPVIENQLRPFARDTLPVAKALQPAASDLAQATPNLTKALRPVNRLLNQLAYNPPGAEEGFLFWAAWAAHDGASIFSVQDGHGAIRRGLVIAPCSSLQVLEQLPTVAPTLGTQADLLNAPKLNQVCPQLAALSPTGPAAPAAPGGGG